MTRIGKVMAVLMVVWMSFCVLWLFGVLPEENIKELTSPAMEKLFQLVSWLKVKVLSLLEIVIQKFFQFIIEGRSMKVCFGKLSFSDS